MNNRSPLSLHVCSEEDGCTEDALEGGYQPSVLGSTLLHAEGVQHLRRASKLNRLALLPDCQRSKEDRDEPVLAPGKPVRGMAGHLKRELAVAPLMKQLAGRGFLDRQSAEHERTRCKTQILIRLLAF